MAGTMRYIVRMTQYKKRHILGRLVFNFNYSTKIDSSLQTNAMKLFVRSFSSNAESSYPYAGDGYNRSRRAHRNMLVSSRTFYKPIPLNASTIEDIVICVILLLMTFVFPTCQKENRYAKFTITLTFKAAGAHGKDPIHAALCDAILLVDLDGSVTDPRTLYSLIYQELAKFAEKYDNSMLTCLTVRTYFAHDLPTGKTAFSDEHFDVGQYCYSSLEGFTPKVPLKMVSKKRYPENITPLKTQKIRALTPFIVADTETVLLEKPKMEGTKTEFQPEPKDEKEREEKEEKEQSPYAIGLMRVYPGQSIDSLASSPIESYYSSDYPKTVFPTHEERAGRLLTDFMKRLHALIKRHPEIKTVYFHNFSRFDGFFLVRHIAVNMKTQLRVKPLIVKGVIYQAHVQECVNPDAEKKTWKYLFTFRDSCRLLTGSLASLGKNLCPELGGKGDFKPALVKLENIEEKRTEALEYMKQDIRLLGGILLKAQDIYYKQYNLDINNWVTISSLALGIYRKQFLEPYTKAADDYIAILNMNQDSFIRKGYYGGHTDVYIPYGENLYYYDVNSLYPYIMKEYDIPSGKPTWHRDLTEAKLDDLFGYIEAYIHCPSSIKRPFLPIMRDDKTLLFPTGKWVGTYYSEELKYAATLGYEILPLSGYLFKRRSSPFKGYVTNLFEERSKAKREKNDSLNFIYKLLMNSLYGRFGINPINTKTDIVYSEDEYNRRVTKDAHIDARLLDENTYLMIYYSNVKNTLDQWKPPHNSAVQISAAITANARIHMYRHISRDDCYYTDTDSVVLGSPIEDDMLSETELGKFKLEDRIKEGYFLAPKSYCYLPMPKEKDEAKGDVKPGTELVKGEQFDNVVAVMKYKGAGKDYVSKEWYQEQYKDPYRSIRIEGILQSFRVNLKNLTVYEAETSTSLKVSLNNKRRPIFKDNQGKLSYKYKKTSLWIDSDAIEVKDFSRAAFNQSSIMDNLFEKAVTLRNLKDKEKEQLLTDLIEKKGLKEKRTKLRKARKEEKMQVIEGPYQPKSQKVGQDKMIEQPMHVEQPKLLTKKPNKKRPIPKAQPKQGKEGKLVKQKPKKKHTKKSKQQKQDQKKKPPP